MYPYTPQTDRLLLCAGEFDALLASQEGIPAASGTLGAGAWRDEWDADFAGRWVAVCFDVGEERAMYRRVDYLNAKGARAWPVRLARLNGFAGKDLSDALTDGYTPDDLKALINSEYRRAA